MLRDRLVKMGACEDAVAWVGDRDITAAWAECERADWMLWLAGRVVARPLVVLAACACARTALRYVLAGEDRPRVAIETAERWARGEATIAEVRSAYADAAYAAADACAAAAAYAAAYAATYAAAAAYAATAYAAAYAAADAAAAAAAAVYAAAADAAAAATAAYAATAAAAVYAAAAYAAAARTKSLSHSAGLVRKHITAAMIEEGWAKP